MLEGLEPLKSERLSRVDEILNGLDAKDQKILKDALNDPNWSANGLSNALRQRGVTLSASSIKRYRDNKR